MIGLILTFCTIGLFLILRARFELVTFRSFVIQVALLIILLAGLTLNTFYSWKYFKQYEGPKDANFRTAHYMEDILTYGLIGTMVFLICSFISIMRRDRTLALIFKKDQE
jgi:hypothetical protein